MLFLSLKLLLLLPGCDNQIICEIILILCPHTGPDPSRCLSARAPVCVCVGTCDDTNLFLEGETVAFQDVNKQLNGEEDLLGVTSR